MGLDVGSVSWAYSGFNRFRTRLAKVCGFILDDMEGFGGSRPWRAPWTGTAGDLVPFLNHSDCDGELTPEECRRIATKLREVISHQEFTQDQYDSDREKGLQLADDMEACAERGEPLEFR